jgi:hypothetical protein
MPNVVGVAARLGALLVVAACASAPTVEQALATGCLGDRYAIVTNRWNQDVDIRADIQDQAAPMTLGTVRPTQRQEFILPVGTRRVYPYVSPLTAAYPTRIDIRYECRR